MATPTCATCPPDPDLCEEILKKIQELINRDKRAEGGGGTHGLKHRFPEQINGKNGPGTPSWDNHEQQIKNQQKALEKKLKEYDKNKCGDPPPGAWDWATRPVPKASEWRDPSPLISPAVAEAAATTAKVGAGALILYGTYRAIRMIPSLFPPLWWTAPANLAVP